MVTNELFKLEKQGITKDGHTMFQEDIVSELNGWRNSGRAFRNKNALLLREIGGLRAFVEEMNNLMEKGGKHGVVDVHEIEYSMDKFVLSEDSVQ